MVVARAGRIARGEWTYATAKLLHGAHGRAMRECKLDGGMRILWEEVRRSGAEPDAPAPGVATTQVVVWFVAKHDDVSRRLRLITQSDVRRRTLFAGVPGGGGANDDEQASGGGAFAVGHGGVDPHDGDSDHHDRHDPGLHPHELLGVAGALAPTPLLPGGGVAAVVGAGLAHGGGAYSGGGVVMPLSAHGAASLRGAGGAPGAHAINTVEAREESGEFDGDRVARFSDGPAHHGAALPGKPGGVAGGFATTADGQSLPDDPAQLNNWYHDDVPLDPLGNRPLHVYRVACTQLQRLADDPEWTPPLALSAAEREVVERPQKLSGRG